MTFHGADLAAMAVLAAAGFAFIYASLRRRLQKALAEQQQATAHRLAALAGKIRVLEHTVAELNQVAEMHASAASEFEMESAEQIAEVAAPVAEEQEEELEDEQVAAEMMPVLAAAVTALLGRKVRVLSARKLQSPRQGLSPWSQQGRVFVQASHNLRARS